MAIKVDQAKVKELLVDAGSEGLTAEQVAAAYPIDMVELDKKDKKRAGQAVRAACRNVVKELGGVSRKASDEPFAKVTYIIGEGATSTQGE